MEGKRISRVRNLVCFSQKKACQQNVWQAGFRV